MAAPAAAAGLSATKAWIRLLPGNLPAGGYLVLSNHGYTQCPNVCPETLAKLNAALHALKPDRRARVTVLFVSVDPTRDTRSVLTHYVHAFNPSFEPVRPTANTLPAITRHYHVAYSYGKPNARGYYVVNHSSAVMIFRPDGDMRLVGSYHDPIQGLADDLRYMIKLG